MLLHVRARTEQALLFAGPQADAHSAAKLDTSGFEDAHRFEHHSGTCAVVSGTCSRVPGIEVRADHHNLISLSFFRAGDLADDVEGIQVVIVKLVLNISLQRDGD